MAVTYTKPVIDKSSSGVDALKALAGEMSAGQVSTLVMLGGNPAYSAPADLQFAVALSKVANSIHLGREEDETAAASKWHLPEAHVLESWGDEATSEGTRRHSAADDRADVRRARPLSEICRW